MGRFYSYHDDGRDGHDALEWIANQPLVQRQDPE